MCHLFNNSSRVFRRIYTLPDEANELILYAQDAEIADEALVSSKMTVSARMALSGEGRFGRMEEGYEWTSNSSPAK